MNLWGPISFAVTRYENSQIESYLDFSPVVSCRIPPKSLGCSHRPIHGPGSSGFCVSSHPSGLHGPFFGEKRFILSADPGVRKSTVRRRKRGNIKQSGLWCMTTKKKETLQMVCYDAPCDLLQYAPHISQYFRNILAENLYRWMVTTYRIWC